MKEFSMALAGVCFGAWTAGGAVSLVPAPAKMEEGTGAFALSARTVIAADAAAAGVGEQLAGMLRPATGFPFPVVHAADAQPAIALRLDPALQSLGREGYRLETTAGGATITAAAEAGLFYGAQTLRQLLPPEIFSSTAAAGRAWEAPCVRIEDVPRFGWRGLHLDEVRHFFGEAFVKKFIDLLAVHKLNTLHWHLTDSQGWRLEIRKYPRLTEVGGWRTGDKDTWDYHAFQYGAKPGAPGAHGGFYTQQQVRDIVEYARQRHVRIVPEIEMPGHSWVALLAYPEFSCFPQQKAKEGTPFCPGKEATYVFFQDVLDEAMALFPSEFIHIGGDEVARGQWGQCPDCKKRMEQEKLGGLPELQSYFTARMTRYIESKGRRAIGWDEILEGGIAPGAVVMSWRGIGGGIAAANKGHDAVMTPVRPLYLDAPQGNPGLEPKTIGYAPNTLRDVYGYEPIPGAVSEAQAKHILGAQGNLWAEWMRLSERVEYMAYPRACALAEVVWSPKASRDFDGFCRRLETHFRRLDAFGVNYRKPRPDDRPAGSWESGSTSTNWAAREWGLAGAIAGTGEYEVEFRYTGGGHRLDMREVELLRDGQVVASDAHEGRTGAANQNNRYRLDVAPSEWKESAAWTLRTEVRSDGGTDSSGEIYVRRMKRQ